MNRRLFLGGLLSTALHAASVKIERVELIKVVVRMKPGVVYSENYGPTLDQRLVVFDTYPKFLIKLYADNGMVGLGETAREVADEAVRRNADFLKGKRVEELDLGLRSLGLPDATTADGFEIALYDLMGKSAGLPVCALLGGGVQKKVAVSYWTAQRTFDDLVRVGETAVAKGFHNLKFKARLGDPIEKQMAAVAKAAPNLHFIVDFNSSYPDLASFLPVAKRLEGYNLTIEDPIPKRLDWFRQLRQRTTIPFALTPTGPEQLYEAIKTDAVDVFNLGGDMREFVRSAAMAEMAGIPCWHGSGVELGIRDMSFIHAAAATRSCTIGSDTLSYLRQHSLITPPFQPVNGYIEVPRKPGLGVELDEDAVKHYQVK
jgi:muconate cycloisomerase